MNEFELLLKRTDIVKDWNRQAEEHFQTYRIGGATADFYDDVKPFVEQVMQDLENWVPDVLKFLEMAKPAYVHAQQIDQLAENVEMVAVTCFQQDTKKKRFREQVKSIDYTLEMVKQAVVEYQQKKEGEQT